MAMYEDVPSDIAEADNLTYIAYEIFREEELTHEEAIELLPLAEGMADKYKTIYELGEKK